MLTGKHTAFGGSSASEAGGAGTIYMQFGNQSSIAESKILIIDNKNQQPKNVYLQNGTDTSINTGKTWIIAKNQSHIELSKLVLKGRAHVAMKPGNESVLGVNTRLFEGDFTGQIHVTDKVNLTTQISSAFFPASFRVYSGGHIGLPERIALDSFANKDVSIDGTISGVKDLTVSSGVRVLFGEKVRHLIFVQQFH